MNLTKLREAEAAFLQQYPGGFENEEMQKVLKKRHNVGKLSEFAADALAKQRFAKPGQLFEDIVKVVSRSSMLSMFEKPKFRDYVNGLSRADRRLLLTGYKKLLHGQQEAGFNNVLDVLSDGKLAKWSLITIHLYHLHPTTEVFVKPTTTKNVIKQFELEGLEYRPRPSWAFYANYREQIERMRSAVDPSLAPNNAAFTGFLMMSMSTDV